MIPFIDIHTHFLKTDENVISIKNFTQNEWKNALYTEGVLRTNVIGKKARFHSVGLHPWFLTKEHGEKDLLKLTKIIENQSIIAIGECGLDKLRGEALDIQTTYFTAQIRLAESVQKPVIIHCVRAFNEVIALKNKLKPTVPLIIHGFNKNEIILKELLKHDFYISIGSAILRGSENFKNAILKIPTDHLFFETDNKDIDVAQVYGAYSEISKIDINNLKSIIYDNTIRTFNPF